MIDKKFEKNNLYSEMNLEDQSEWFGYNQKSFLNNILPSGKYYRCKKM